MPDRPTYRPVYKALHRPLTIWGVDRRLFFLSLLLGAATFNLFYSFAAGLLMFFGLYAFALWAIAARIGGMGFTPASQGGTHIVSETSDSRARLGGAASARRRFLPLRRRERAAPVRSTQPDRTVTCSNR